MANRVVFDENGEIISVIDEDERIEQMMAVEKDPYWKSAIPKTERKHKKPAKITWSAGKIAILAVAGLFIIGCLYYIVAQLVNA